MVGGWVRDVVAGRRSDDVDVASDDPKTLAAFLGSSGARSVACIDSARGTWRVRLQGGQQVDVAALQGSLSEDLRRRDLAINAMAWSPRLGLVDPLDGCGDLQRGVLRLASPAALRDDPLRALRLWRFAVELDARPAELPRDLDLTGVAGERSCIELSKLLSHDGSPRALRGLAQGALLEQLLPGPFRIERFAALRASPCDSPALARCWEHVERSDPSRSSVYLGWLCAHPDLAEELVRRRWPKATARSAAATSTEVDREAGAPADDLMRWKCQAAWALLGHAAGASEPGAHAEACLRALDSAAGARNPKGLPVPPLPRSVLSADEVCVLGQIKPGPALASALDHLVRGQLAGSVTGAEEARQWLSGWDFEAGQ